MRSLKASFLILLAAAGCSSDRWVREAAFKSDSCEVYREHRLEDDAVAAQGFEHPFTIEDEDLAAILAGLLYQESSFLGKKSKAPVFGPDEIDVLAPALAGALGEVGPDERLFFITQNWGGGVIFSNRRTTRGVVFVEPGGVLNVAFVEINEEFSPTDYAQMGRERSVKEPTEITRANRPLVALPWLSLRPCEGTGGVHPLWGVIDAGEVKKTLASIRSKAAAPPDAAATPERPAGSAAVMTISGVKEKLKLLKELFDEGLITEEEYSQKKAQLLEKL